MQRLIIFLLSVIIFYKAGAQGKPEGLFINSKAFDFKGKDQNGKDISLKEMRKKGNVIVLFYRGNWCPYCNRQLTALQDSLQLLTNKGAQVVAITPEAPEGIAATITKTKASFPILYDEDMKIANAYQVAFFVDDKTVQRSKNAGIDFLQINHQKEAALPVPAVYIVNKDGFVTFRYFNEDYRKRVSVKEILTALDKPY